MDTNKARFDLRYLSLGAGVQSTTLALLAADEIVRPMPDVAIYADTGWDPPETRAVVDWLTGVLPYPVETVTAGSLPDDLHAGRSHPGGKPAHFSSLPTFGVRLATGEKTMKHRQCTKHYKIEPIERRVRELVGLAPGERAPKSLRIEHWLGISWDEIGRAKTDRRRYVTRRWPLIELRWRRADCVTWWTRNAPDGAPELGRSACVGCPFHSSDEWIWVADRHPDLLAAAAETERRIQRYDAPGYRSYLHQRRIPLLDAVAADRASARSQPGLFDAECDGVCGV